MTDVASRGQRALIPVIISGGSGTRLWPLSRESHPKQFLPLVGRTSLYQQTLLRVRELGFDVRAPIVVCNALHRELVSQQAQELDVELAAVVLEPIGRNTAPAVAIAALVANQRDAGAADPLLLVLPADHVIGNTRAFADAVGVAMDAAESGRLVTFGVVPDRPETGYGYIKRGQNRGAWDEIDRFVEKPDRRTAEAYVSSGQYVWNSGMFLFPAKRLLEELRAHSPAMFEACARIAEKAPSKGIVVELDADFAKCPADSIDYAVMEKTAFGAVVPLDAAWSDVGSWPALHDALPRDAQGNAASGNVLLESCQNTYVNASSRIVAAIGLDDVVVVETADAVLVLKRDRAQDVKKIVDALRSQRQKQA